MGQLQRYGVADQGGRPYEEAIYSLALIYNLIDARISTYLKDFQLTPGKFNILMAVKHQAGPDGISQVDVSKHLIVTPSNMSKLIDKLEVDGYVARSPLPGDRRVHMLKVTRAGSLLLDKLWPGYLGVLQGLCADLGRGKQAALAGLLMEWLKALTPG